MHKEIRVHIEGVSPLLMHNIQLANPMNKWARSLKEISSKRKKTETDLEEIARLEFLGGMYVNENSEPIVPSINLEGMLRDGAKAQRLGKAFQAGVFVEEDAALIYSGPRTAEKLWLDEAHRCLMGVRVQAARVMRMRAMFRDWQLKFTIGFRPDMLNAGVVKSALEHAGSTSGMLDYRPKFGRFTVLAFDVD